MTDPSGAAKQFLKAPVNGSGRAAGFATARLVEADHKAGNAATSRRRLAFQEKNQ
jgi:hypothetical protein